MAWKRESDTVAFDPRVVAVVEHPDADERSVNEVWGFFSRMMAMLAQHKTNDFRVSLGVALPLAGGSKAHVMRLWSQCEFAGLGTVIETEDGRPAFLPTIDPEDLVHIKTGEQITFERQRKADNGKVDLTVLVRHRDGDTCRYCYKVVNWNDRRSNVGGTYDHRPPGRTASTADDLVVACKSCNSARGEASKGFEDPVEALAAADEVLPLRRPMPYYGSGTRTWLNRHEALLAASGLVAPPPASDSDRSVRAGTLAPGAAAAAPDGDDARRATEVDRSRGARRDAPAATPEPASTADRQIGVRYRQIGGIRKLDTPGRDGSGRVRSGLDGSGPGPGRDGPGSGAEPPSGRRRRRGGRGRGKAAREGGST